jgi:aspartyl-tRNA(Asn)/glutamyl-tRNA(Gln) amidotransferase subunit A
MVSRRAFVGSLLATSAVAQRDLSDISTLIKDKSLSPVELTKACLQRIEALNPKLNAFITVTATAAIREAESLESELRAGRRRGPLHGIPIGLKDLYDTAGVKTTAGSKHWADRVPADDAAVVARLRAAGAVIVGKLNMDEFAYNFTAETSAFGPARNPWNVARSPGGSSGGSAVAVATGMCLAALGSDTGGSIRLPAALCGITGFKPTYGSVSAEGVAPLAWSLDHVGPMCRSARDAMLMMEVLTGKPTREVGIRSLRFGIPRSVFYDTLDPQVASAVAAATAVLAKRGGGVREVVLPTLTMSREAPDLPEPYITVIIAEAYAFHEQMVRERRKLYHPGTLRSIRNGAAISAPQYIRAKREMDRLREDSDNFFKDVDLLITPTALGPAFAFGKGTLAFLRNTAPWNMYGLPTVSIPCGFTTDNLPIGLQITGRRGADDVVLAAAAAYQDVTDWHRRQPPV